MNEKTEIRKLPVACTNSLIQYLESSLLWKELMVKIPKNLDEDESVPKYNSEHVALIEDAAVKQKRCCCEILFEEWGTSGRRRPTIQDLLELLIKNEMYRAADIVSKELLNVGPVERPDAGPAAKIDVSLTKILRENPIDHTRIVNMLEKMSYPSTVTNTSTNVFNKNLDIVNKNLTKKYEYPLLMLQTMNSPDPVHSVNLNDIVSDFMKFTQGVEQETDINENAPLPLLSTLLAGGDGQTKSHDTLESSDLNPAFSMLLKSSNYSQSSIVDQTEELSESDEDDVEEDLPNLSIIQKQSTNVIMPISVTNDDLIPMLSALQVNTSAELTPSLRTNLPHVKYKDIEIATCYFSEFPDFLNNKGGKIGSGGFGVVYLAFTSTKEPVAVKRLLKNDSPKYNELILKQFNAEVDVLSKYSHINIVSLLGYSCDGPANCLIYEYVDGGSLREKLDKRILPALDRIRISVGTCAGIEHLHIGKSTPLIHRDVKTANILLTTSGIPKLCDFGLAKSLMNQRNTTTIIGTSAYMAPETFRGDVSVKMDVFSFGIVLLELLTGLPPTDELRKGVDIFTHVMEVCTDGNINCLLDMSGGNWQHSNEIFNLAMSCLKEKQTRPYISAVKERLMEISNLICINV